MSYFYQIQAYEYSDFETWELTHEKKYTKEEFKEICKKAHNKIPETPYEWNYISNLLNILIQEYGFKSAEYCGKVHIEDLIK